MFPFPKLFGEPPESGPPPSGEEYVAVGFSAGPGLKILTRSGDTFFDVGQAPSGWPTGAVCQGVSWHPTEPLLAVGSNSAPYILFFDMSTGTPVNVTLGTVLGQAARVVKWSPNGQYLAVSLQASPWLSFYSYSGGVLTQLTNPATLPENRSHGLSWSSDSTRVIVSETGATSAAGRLYGVSGSTVSYITTWGGVASALTVDSADDDRMVGGFAVATFLRGFVFGAGQNSLVASANPPVAASSAGAVARFSDNSLYFAGGNGTGINISQWTGAAYTSLGIFTAGNLSAAAWTKNDICMVGLASSPFMAMRKVVDGALVTVTHDTGIFNAAVLSLDTSFLLP